MEKGPRTNVCNVLASFHKVMKLQSFFWKWHRTCEYTTHFFTGFLCIFLLISCRKSLYGEKPLWCFWPFFTKLWSYEILNDKTVSRRKWRYPRKWTYITLASMLILRTKLWLNSWSISFCFMMKRIILRKSCYFGLMFFLTGSSSHVSEGL